MTNKKAAIRIIKRLRSNGFEALLAGGCVRDMLLKRPAKDFDVATDAQPVDVIKLFKRTLKVGAKFGVVIVLLDKNQIEVATFRTESGYTDGRHPTEVEFTIAAADASRRDFTINGMFYDPIKEKLIDYVNGRTDLKKKIIRTIGSPQKRFAEDYLRMLRAVRFAAQIEFSIDSKTFSAICKSAKNIKKISGERITAELEGILAGPSRARGATLLVGCGLANTIFPGFTQRRAKSAVDVLAELPKQTDFPLALAGFFVDWPVETALEKFRILKFSRNRARHVKFLLGNRGRLLDENISLAQLKILLAEPYFTDLYELQRAIQKADTKGSKGLSVLRKLKKRIKALGDIELKPKPILNGHDLIRLGATPGPALGQLAGEMYIAQLEGTLTNKTAAKKWVQKWLGNHKMMIK